MKILFINSLPSITKGGAVETLIEHLISENEIEKNMN